MKKVNIREKTSQHFDDLAEELGSRTKLRYIRNILKPYRHLLLALVSVVLLSLAYASWQFYRTLEWSQSQTEAYAETLSIKDRTHFRYDWTAEAVENIKADPKGSTGTDLETIIAQHGLPSSTTVHKDESGEPVLIIVYDRDAFQEKDSFPRQDVSFQLKRIEGVFHVTSKIGRFLASNFLPATEREYHYRWTDTAIASLEVDKLGDVVTGSGGASIEEVIADYGLPSSSLLVVNSYETQILLDYEDLENGGTLGLSFLKQADGRYLLSGIDKR